MDFGDSVLLEKTKQEVVLSFKRIESVFGPIAPPPMLEEKS